MSYTAWVIIALAALVMNIISILMNLRDQKPNGLNITLAIVNAMLMVYFAMRAMAS